ncbi:capsid [uncultured virus]|uniref:Capsid n=1 Tax=uncultured virus TaxID=340016 RepID=A0A2K9LT02_9VIRU|nr:capsid [uncultured virus]
MRRYKFRPRRSRPVYGPHRARRVVHKRRTTRPRRAFTGRKRLLNITSEKKWDDMPQYYTDALGDHTQGSITFTATNRFLFLASARPLYFGISAKDNNRQSKETFAVGYKERIEIDVENAQQWRWRRIAFRFVGDPFVGTGTAASVPFYDNPTAGMTRNLNTMNLAQLNTVQGIIYEGTQGVDWFDERVAKVDRRRINLISDSTMHLKGFNDQSHSHTFNRWYGVRKRLVYNDVQDGKTVAGTNYVSVQDNKSCGDVYIYDYFYNTAGDIGEPIQVTFQGRWYWHER